MITVNLREAREMVEAAILADVPSLLMGIPGIGKTSIYKWIAKKLGMGCRVEDGTSLDPVDARGAIVPDTTTGNAFFTRPAIFPDKEDGEKGLLVIDEIGGCLPATQKALQTVLLERRSGKHELPKGWIPVGTANYATDGAGAYTLLSSLEDRALIINVAPDFGIWKEDFALPMDVDHRVISFLNWRPDLFNTFEKRNKGEKGKGFASARSWEKTSKLIKTDKLSGNTLLAAVAGCVSEGIASEFVAFLRVHESLPDIKKIYRGNYNQVPEKPDVLYALSGALVSFLGRLPDDLPKTMAIDRFFDYSMKLPAEFTVLCVKDALPLHKEDMLRSKGWVDFSKKFKDLVV